MKTEKMISGAYGVRDERVRDYIMPKHVVFKTGNAENTKMLLKKRVPQLTLSSSDYSVLTGAGTSVMLDFGMEFSGSVKIFVQGVVCESQRARLGIRFGESVSEAMTPIGDKNATNDEANRDFVIEVGTLTANETNESGLRFVCITLLDDATVKLGGVMGVFYHRDIQLRGSFECSDERLGQIWKTAAYTVFLNMQNYLWDGVKRDRLVWAGDMHTEVRTMLAAFGENDIVPSSLELLADKTPEGRWMNNIPSYSLWWLMILRDWHVATGDTTLLTEKKEFVFELISRLMASVGEDGREELEDFRFLDWQTSKDPIATHEGLQGLMKLGMDACETLAKAAGNDELADECRECARRVSSHIPEITPSKQAAAMLALSGICDARDMNERIIALGGAHGYSTFMGYYILKAKAEAGDVNGALDDIRAYWGGMLDMGATTFWEDFNIDWMDNSYRIDDVPRKGLRDIHGDFGDYCYKGLRHSLCHGWASGPCAFLSEYVLGVRQTGYLSYDVKPNLGELDFARGKYPTPLGDIEVDVRRRGQRISVKVKAPHGVKIRK